MSDFRMPSLGADMESGTLTHWHVKPGSKVRRGDIVAEVETDKGNIEIEIWDEGEIGELLVTPGKKVPVGTVLATVKSVAATTKDDLPVEKPRSGDSALAVLTSSSAQPKTTALPALAQIQTGPPHAGRLRITPLARRVAAELQVNLAVVPGSGMGGAITRVDVEKAHQECRTRAAPGETNKIPVAGMVHSRGMRQAIAAIMSRSKKEIPHYYLQTRICMEAAQQWLTKENSGRPVTERILPTVLLLKAVAVAAGEVPELNGYFIDGSFHPSIAVHVGVAISLRKGGLVAPAVHNVEDKALPALMQNFLDLVNRARAGKLKSSELSDATITVTSLGETGVETVFGVIYPPQVALVGFGKITDEPWALNGMVGVKPTIIATLAADHRVSDGHRGGLFLSAVNRHLQTPGELNAKPGVSP